MSIAFYTGVSGLMAAQTYMDATANNMANVNTTGYKTQNAYFRDLLYTKMNIHKNYGLVEGPDGQPANETDIPEEERAYDLVGHGVKIGGVHLMFEQGSFLNTERQLDFAVDGSGFFAVEKNSGETEYTRNGRFHISIVGSRAYLVNEIGDNVLDNRGKEISLTLVNGVPQTDDLIGKIGIYTFPNPYGLTPAEGGSFLESDISGEAEALDADSDECTVLQGWLENSNVNIGDQMLNLIQAQRTYQMNSRVIQTADQIIETINGLR